MQDGGSRLLNHCIFSRGCLRSLVKPVFAAGSGDYSQASVLFVYGKIVFSAVVSATSLLESWSSLL